MFSSNTSQVSSDANWIEECFQTHLYTGNGSTQTIDNGIDLSTYGGLVWMKSRSAAYNHALIDTARTASYYLSSNATNAQSSIGSGFAFNTNGFTANNSAAINQNTQTYASWTFRKQPKFFDIVTYTGNGTAGRTVAHNLGSVPGCMIVKRTDASNGWAVYHRSMNASPQDYMMRLNATDGAFTTSPSRWNNTLPTATEFTLSGNDEVNGSGATYVAYLFAHNAGGFGLTGTDNVISCGSFTTDGSGNATVSLGYEPQWILVKANASGNDWYMYDNMRGLSYSNYVYLSPNLSAAEGNIAADYLVPTATGFNTKSFASSTTYIYIAIRRGPMKVPTSGTTVFQPASFTSTASRQTMGSLSVVDMFMGRRTNSIKDWGNASRLTGNYMLKPNLTDAQDTNVTGYGDSVLFDLQNGSSMITSGSGDPFITYNFHRAPSFFDEVCYTGTGSNMTISHNLGVVPELMIVKMRSTATFTGDWYVYASGTGNTKYGLLSLTNSFSTSSGAWNNTTPTASSFYVGTDFAVSETGKNFVAYLFATCPGVSKCFNYTGNGSSQTINCGFTGGARWILIKRTDSTGDWYVWDSARGIVSGNDPHLSLNSTAAEVTSDDTIDTDSTGFVVNQVSATNVNVSSATYIGIAIA